MIMNHVGLYVKDLESMKDFYCRYFEGKASALYTNNQKRFSSYFISFDGGARLELMAQHGLTNQPSEPQLGFAHLAFSLGSKARVDALTKQLKDAGYTVSSGPRVTGDGYYESVVLDPEDNAIELTE
jgi:lactoylglutathione lyase